ncbi:MAG: hypothetical protein WB791_11390 [Waddliaceae bacterium]
MDLLEKIKKIEALIERASSEGERTAAELAKQRLKEKVYDCPIEFQISSHSRWEKKLFAAVCRKNGFSTYRYQRQKYTTSMVRVNKRIMNEVLWPEYQKFCSLLREMFDEIADDLIDKIHNGDREEVVISGQIANSN